MKIGDRVKANERLKGTRWELSKGYIKSIEKNIVTVVLDKNGGNNYYEMDFWDYQLEVDQDSPPRPKQYARSF